ncbi:MAG: hypothetical protein ACQGVC_11325 [Myxococcota bacterium]
MSAATASSAAEGAIAEGPRARVLRCRSCGSREATRAPARVHGWQRCGHCGEVIVAPWSDWEAFDGPHARTVVLERRGRAHFLVPRGTLLRGFELALWLFILNTIAAFSAGAFEIEADPHGTWRWLGPLLCALAAVTVSALFVRLWSGVQHLEINPHRLVTYRTVGARRFRQAEHALRGGLEIDTDVPVETVSEGRHRVRLRDPQTQRTLADLLVPTAREARWVATLVRRAVDPEACAESPRCSGCGAPLDVRLGAHAEGGVTCPYCDAGFVVGSRALHWPPLVVPLVEIVSGTPGRAPDRSAVASRRRRSGRSDEQHWEIRGGARPFGWFGALGLAANVVFFGGFGVACLWISGNTPEGAWGLTLWTLFAAAMMFGIALFVLGIALFLVFGRERLSLDDATFARSGRVFGRDLAALGRLPVLRHGLVPGQWRTASAALPLVRLTGVEFERDGGYTRLRLRTPTRELEAVWYLPVEADRWLRRELANALAERLGALGRDVALRPV